MEKSKKYISNEEYLKKYQHLTLCKGDIVSACSGGSWGKTAIYWKDEKVMLNTSTLRLRFFNDIGNNLYLYLITKSTFFKNQLKHQLSGMQPNFGYAHYSKILIPLPPIQEQQRIVSKIESLEPFIDDYNQAETELSKLNETFPEQIKKSILQYAIQGKLVPQDPSDEPASVLLAKIKAEKQKLINAGKIKKDKVESFIYKRDNRHYEKIGDKEIDITDEIPFEIPDSWSWVRLRNYVDVRDGTHDTPAYVPTGIPLITGKNLCDGKISFDNVKYISYDDAKKIDERSFVADGDIIFAMIGSIGNPVLVHKQRPFCIKNLALLKQYIPLSLQYLVYLMEFMQEQMKKEANGGVQSFVSLNYIRNLLIALPPLKEQARIVSKIEDIFKLFR